MRRREKHESHDAASSGFVTLTGPAWLSFLASLQLSNKGITRTSTLSALAQCLSCTTTHMKGPPNEILPLAQSLSHILLFSSPEYSRCVLLLRSSTDILVPIQVLRNLPSWYGVDVTTGTRLFKATAFITM